jgi:uncharacterized protein (TIGR02598 family)
MNTKLVFGRKPTKTKVNASLWGERGIRHQSLLMKSRLGAFSLIEVVLAIGIISVAFVGIVGLLPVGLTTLRQSVDATVGTQILQRIVSEAQQTDYPTLVEKVAGQRFFNDQGTEVANIKDSIYTAQISVTAQTNVPRQKDSLSDNLATISVKLANNPGHIANPFGDGSKVAISVFSALIAKSQHD